MTVLSALALALVTVTGACPAACDADPLQLPELPGDAEDLVDPPRVDADPKPPEQPLDRAEDLPADASDLFDAFASTHLPTGDDRELVTSLGSPAPTTDLASGGEDETEPEGTAPAPEPGEEHAPVDREGPRSEGEVVHAPSNAPQAYGERVGERPGNVLVSLLVGLGAIGLYHKLSKDRALEHTARRRILTLLAEEPGLGTGDVARELDVAYRTARHHLEVLARFDLVVKAKQEGCWRWARPEDANRLDEREVPVLQKRLLAELEEEPGLHLSELARRLDAAKATVKHHLDDLDERERVRDERVGPLRRFFPAEAEEPASS